MNKEELAKAFDPQPVPAILMELLELDESGEGWISNGFEFQADEDNAMLGTYSEDPAFVNRFITFAQADSTGSSYALWLREEAAGHEAAPVVVFGGEGGVQVVAGNLKEWLQLLSVDVEPMVDWDGVDYYKDPAEYEPSDRIGEFHAWLSSSQQLDPLEDASPIVDQAQGRYQEALDAFIEAHRS